MTARADLLAVAEAIAAEAKRQIPDDLPLGLAAAETAAGLMNGAHAAFQAAALAEDTPASDIDQALTDLQSELDETGLLADSIELPAGEFLKVVLTHLQHYKRSAMMMQAGAEAYQLLAREIQRMADQFAAAGTPVAVRNAERMRSAIDESAELINQAAGVTDDTAKHFA